MTLRLARASDAAFLLRVRNDPTTRQASRTRREITLKEHEAWFAKTTDRIFIAEVEDVAVGTVRLTRHTGWLEINLAVAPEHRGKGYATQMIQLGAKEAWAPVVAYVRAENDRSLKAFKRAGFVEEGTYVRFTAGSS